MPDHHTPARWATRMPRRTVLAAGAAAATAGLGGALRLPAYAQGPRRIKIGYVSPQTGPLAAFGEADKFVIGEVQKLLKDGLTLGGRKHPMQVVVRDSQSNPNRAGEVAADLILKEKVDIMAVGDVMDDKGWHLDRQEGPAALHMMISPEHARVADEFLADLRHAVAHHGAARGKAARYS